jgi:hypothetical protein
MEASVSYKIFVRFRIKKLQRFFDGRCFHLMTVESKIGSVLEVDGYITFFVLIIFPTHSSVTLCIVFVALLVVYKYRGADNSLARPGRKNLQRQKILSFIYHIYSHNWRNINTIYIYVYNKTSIKRNILTIQQNTAGSRSG